MTPLPQILAVARAGNPARAWALFHAAGWDAQRDDPKALTLKGRLLKDQAKAGDGVERSRLYGLAAEAYAAAAALQRDSYPLVNAAALALLGGGHDRAAALAREVLALLDEDPAQGENPYWRSATRAEALLLLGDEPGARAALSDAIAKLPAAWEDHAATLGQFELILAEQGRDMAWLDRFRPPPSLYFSGIIGLDEADPAIAQDIDAIIARERPGFGFGALAAGADILIAEALSEAGAELHVTLPYPVDRFRELSVAPFGQHWIPRFDTLVQIAARVDVLTELPDEEERGLATAVELADRVAMGQCIRNAATLKSRPQAMTITGREDEPRRHYQLWSETGHDQFTITAARKADHRSVTATAGTESKEIAAILCVDDRDGDALSALPEGIIAFRPAGDACYAAASDPAALLSVAQQVLRRDANSRISLLIDIMDPLKPVASLLAQASDMAQAAGGGTVLTDGKSAMVLMLQCGDHQIEEIGELQTAYGALPLWSIA